MVRAYLPAFEMVVPRQPRTYIYANYFNANTCHNVANNVYAIRKSVIWRDSRDECMILPTS
jgi:hypothetical protein